MEPNAPESVPIVSSYYWTMSSIKSLDNICYPVKKIARARSLRSLVIRLSLIFCVHYVHLIRALNGARRVVIFVPGLARKRARARHS